MTHNNNNILSYLKNNYILYFTAPVAQLRKRWTSELTGSESLVRAALSAHCLLLSGMVSRARKVASFSISMNLELLFCEMFDCKE